MKLEKRELKAGEMGFGILLILFSIFAIYESYRISRVDLTLSSPGAFPMFISTLLLVFTCWIGVENYYSKRPKKQNVLDKTKALGSLILSRDILLTIVFLIIYALVLEKVGFVISTVIFLWTSISFLSRGKIIKSLGISILIVVFIVLIFNTIFNVVLP